MEKTSRSTWGFSTTRFIPISKKKSTASGGFIYDADTAPTHPDLPLERETLLKKIKASKIGNFCIEISKTPLKFFISAVNITNPDKNYLIELDKETSEVIMKEFSQNLNLIC